MESTELTVTMELVKNFEFSIHFDDAFDELLMDEPTPMGRDRGPNASRVLSAALGNCLTASLLFCLRKSKLDPAGMSTKVITRIERNDKGRLRIVDSRVQIQVDSDPALKNKLNRCLGLFEDFCVVTQSVRSGIPVQVEVVDADGQILHQSGPEPA